MSSVYVCIVSRDQIGDDVLSRVSEAAKAAGLPVELAKAASPYGVVQARNIGVANFLKTDHDRLLFVDDDVLIPANAIADLASMEGDVVGGCIPSIRTPADGPTFSYVQVQKPFGDWWRTWPTGIVEAESVGGGCMMIGRHVIEAIGFPWFRWPEQFHDGKIVAQSDDTDFCGRAKCLGFSVRANGAVRCGHRKTVDVAMMIQ